MIMSSQKKTVEIKEFNLSNIAESSKIVIIGKPASGKSVLIKDIITSIAHKIPVAKVFSGTEGVNHFYAKECDIPELFIHNEYNEDYMKDFAHRQEKAIKDNKQNPKGLLVIDDCSDDPKFFGRPIFQKFFKNGRQWDMMLILALQYSMDIKPSIRTNIDYSFIFRDPNEKNRKSIYENYAGIIGSFQDFCDIMDQVAEDYTAIVINNRTQSNKLSDCVFYFKATMHKDITFGSTEYKQWGSHRYNSNYNPISI